MIVTQWFEPTVCPVRPGEYEVFQVGMRFWNGFHWVHPSGLKVIPLRPWRGTVRQSATQQANTEQSE